MNASKNSFTLAFNYSTQKISATVVNTNGTVNKQIDMPVGAAAIASFAVRGDYNNANRRCYFDNLKITTEIGNYAVASTTYTVKYKSGDVEIKDASTGRVGDVGATPVLEASDMETFYSADGSKKYVYASDDASTTTIADGGTTVVTVNFTTYEKRTYTLNAVDNTSTVLGELATGYVYADAPSVTVNIPWYVLYGGTLYNKDGNSTTFDVTTNAQTSTVEYTITDKTNVVFYSEGEDLTGVTKVTNNIASKKGIARIPNETTYTNLGAGSYTVYVRAHAGNSSGGTAIFKAGDVEFARKSFAGSTNNQDFNASFALTGSTDVKIKYDCGNATGLDYIYVVKDSDDPIITATITSAGWSTLYTPYALDFSTLSAEVEAYTATLSGTTVTLNKVDDVPANTGVVLKKIGGTGSYDIPVIASSATEKGNLTGNASAATPYDAGTNRYYLALNGESKAQFKKLTSGSIAAGKAFLETAVTAPVLNVVFGDDNMTGIADVRGKMEDVRSDIFDLQGRKVAQPQKGLYIVNGKKVVIK